MMCYGKYQKEDRLLDFVFGVAWAQAHDLMVCNLSHVDERSIGVSVAEGGLGYVCMHV